MILCKELKEIGDNIQRFKLNGNVISNESTKSEHESDTNYYSQFLAFPFHNFEQIPSKPSIDSQEMEPTNIQKKDRGVDAPPHIKKFTKTSLIHNTPQADTVQFIKMNTPCKSYNVENLDKTPTFIKASFIWPRKPSPITNSNLTTPPSDGLFKANTIWKTPESLASISQEGSDNIMISSLVAEKPVLESDKKIFDHLLIDSLRHEIEKVRLKLCEIGKNPSDGIVNSSESYEVTQNQGDEKSSTIVVQLEDMKKKNEQLEKELSEHIKFQANSADKAMDAKNLLNEYEKKVNALHEEALKSSKMMAASKEKFVTILKTRNGQIKNLISLNNQLKETIEANEDQIKSLKNSQKILKLRLQECLEERDQAKSDNLSMEENLRKVERDLKVAYKESNRLKEENLNFEKELIDLRTDLCEKFNNKLNKQKQALEKKVAKSREIEMKLREEIKQLSQQLQEKGNALVEIQNGSKTENMELQMKYNKLQNQFDALVRKFKEYEYFDEIKCNCIEQELKGFSMKMQEKESIIIRERDELRTLVEELAHVIKQNKQSLNELSHLNAEQDNAIQELNAIISQKNVQIEKYEEEIKTIREDGSKFQAEIESLKMNPSSFRDEERERELEKEIENLKEKIIKETDSSRIKEKVIENQDETIRNLKTQITEKSNEIQIALNDWKLTKMEIEKMNEELNKIKIELIDERREKNQALEQLKEMHKHKEALVNKVNELEKTIKSYCLNENSMSLESKITVNMLEDELREQKKEWEEQKKILQNDKEKAIHAAKFASQKLLDTVNDFQKQISVQKVAQVKLTHMLWDKEQQLEKLNLKVKTLLHPDGNYGKIISASTRDTLISALPASLEFPSRDSSLEEGEVIAGSLFTARTDSNSCNNEEF